MANSFINKKNDLTTTDLTTVYTVPSFKTAVVKSILVSDDSGSGTTITVTITKHGIAIGKTVTLDFTSGSATDGTFIVATAVDQNTFTVTASASATNSGNVTATVSGSYKFVCEGYTKSIPYNNRATIKAQFREVFEP